MTTKKKAAAKTASTNPMFDAVALDLGFNPVRDLGAPFDLDATIFQSYQDHAPSHVPNRIRHG